jgi:mono/diheme cytochrome c family protein
MTITATPAPTLFASAEQVAAGQELFNLYCIGCHGLGGVGSNVAPAFNNRPPLAADVIRRQVRSGRYAMTPFDPSRLSDDQLELLVRYIQSLGVIEFPD